MEITSEIQSFCHLVIFFRHLVHAFSAQNQAIQLGWRMKSKQFLHFFPTHPPQTVGFLGTESSVQSRHLPFAESASTVEVLRDFVKGSSSGALADSLNSSCFFSSSFPLFFSYKTCFFFFIFFPGETLFLVKKHLAMLFL